MDQQLKQRLIGVTIIVALVVIFVPMLFDTSDKRTKVAGDNIPPIPDNIVEKSIELPKTAEDLIPKEEQKPAETGYRVIPLTDDIPAKKPAQDSAPPKSAAPAESRDSGEDLAVADEDLPAEKPEDVPPEAVKSKPPAKASKADALPAKLEPKKAKPVPVEAAPVHGEAAAKAEAPKPKATPAPVKAPLAAAKPAEVPAKKPEAPKPPETPKPAAPRPEAQSAPIQSKAAVPPAAPKATPAPAPVGEALKTSAAPKPADPSPNPRPASKPAAPEKSEPATAWVIQAGSFTNEDKARALADKLRQAKFAAFVEAVHGDNGSIYRVQVGPELDRGRAEQMQKQMESNAGVKGLILPHR